jgi:hypothetical protein
MTIEPLASEEVRVRREFAALCGWLRFCFRVVVFFTGIGDDTVTVEPDSGAPGHVVVTSYLPVQPGATVTIVPRRLGDLIFDIDVEAKADRCEELRVIDIP